MGFLVDTIETVLLALILFLIINAVSARVRVENISMQPTLYQDEFVLVNKMAYKLGQAHHGDIIIFHYPRNPKEDYIKRLIGLPGDEVKIDQGKVYVNGTTLDEPYIAAPAAYTGTWIVPEGNYFVLGDNRNQSSDSHVWGYVSTDLVVGKALVIYWPLKDLQILAHPDIVNAAQ
jgi:signal peptidase I